MTMRVKLYVWIGASMKIVTYSRVSTSHHDQNPEIQVLELRRYCESRGWKIVEEIKDFASGATDKREGLKRLFAMVIQVW